jgi:hypothetical protein
MGLVLAGVAFFLWLIGQVYWQLLIDKFHDSPVRRLAQLAGAGEMICIFLAIVVISIGMMQSPKAPLPPGRDRERDY